VDSADELFHDPSKIDLVVISTPNRTHVPLALQAIEARRPVVVDKPVAVSSAEARQLVDEAQRRSVFLSVYHNRRWDGDFLTIRRLLAEQAAAAAEYSLSSISAWTSTDRRPEIREPVLAKNPRTQC
jgi:scyllo-inositol 2-dehydrogenase (NADP+)